ADVAAREEDVVAIADELEANLERTRDLRQVGRIAPRHATAVSGERNGAIDRAGVEQAIPEPLRQALRNGRLASPGGPVDGDDDARPRSHYALTQRSHTTPRSVMLLNFAGTPRPQRMQLTSPPPTLLRSASSSSSASMRYFKTLRSTCPLSPSIFNS